MKLDVTLINWSAAKGLLAHSLAETIFHMVVFTANQALVVQPIETVLEFTATFFSFLIFFITNLATVSFVFLTSFNAALPSFKSVMRHAVNTFSSVISQTSISHFLTMVFFIQVKPTFTVDTTPIV